MALSGRPSSPTCSRRSARRYGYECGQSKTTAVRPARWAVSHSGSARRYSLGKLLTCWSSGVPGRCMRMLQPCTIGDAPVAMEAQLVPVSTGWNEVMGETTPSAIRRRVAGMTPRPTNVSSHSSDTESIPSSTTRRPAIVPPLSLRPRCAVPRPLPPRAAGARRHPNTWGRDHLRRRGWAGRVAARAGVAGSSAARRRPPRTGRRPRSGGRSGRTPAAALDGRSDVG
jgi:hypothetical protein